MLYSATQNIGEVNELASFTLNLSLQDDNSDPTNPATLEWRLVCVETDTVLQAWTSITPTLSYDDFSALVGVTAELSVSGALHAMQTGTLARERKALIIVADRGNNEFSLECTYNVVRLAARS
jgi:hypothetical protein